MRKGKNVQNRNKLFSVIHDDTKTHVIKAIFLSNKETN